MTHDPIDPATVVDAVDPAWDRGRVESALDGLHRRKRRRAAARVATGVVVAAAAAALLWFAPFPREAAPTATPAPSTAPRPAPLATTPQVLELPDGSTVTPADGASRVAVREATVDHVALSLESGGARFDVVPNPSRPFEVAAGDVFVSVLGTVFDVSREEDRVRVSVTRGRVRVRWPGAETVLEAGEEGTYPPRITAAVDPPAPVAEAAAPRRQASARDWRRPAEDGAYEEAHALLTEPTAVRDDVGDLMLAADVQRYSGHAAQAIPYLERVTRAHANDARAPLAAFTSGRILLEQLGRAREAAEAFALARRLEPNGSLAQDALAREAQAWGRAEVPMEARRCADEYLRRYPGGRRAEMMRRWASPADP